MPALSLQDNPIPNKLFRVHWVQNGQPVKSNPKTIEEVEVTVASLMLDSDVTDVEFKDADEE